MATERYKVESCLDGRTYKYVLDTADVDAIWQSLADRFGDAIWIPSIKIAKLDARSFVLKATEIGNPITLILKRKCLVEDLASFHELINFEGELS